MNELTDVGKHNYSKKLVSRLNNEIFLAMKDSMSKSSHDDVTLWHIGWYDLGKAVDWLEENYTISKKERGD